MTETTLNATKTIHEGDPSVPVPIDRDDIQEDANISGVIIETTFNAPKTIYEGSLSALAQSNIPLDITKTATPCRYRLLSCVQIVEHDTLQITEFLDLTDVEYSALSYVWRGNRIDPSQPAPERFGVVGALDGDPIGVEVLKHACLASLKKKVEYLWMDRLCIIQTSREDKQWQISKMYNMYKSCARCIVLPGGVQRLVRLDEETAWIHRAWTLQECLAPKEVVVLFSWKLGPGECHIVNEYGIIEEVIPRQSAITTIGIVTNACVTGYMEFDRRETKGEIWVKTCVFGVGTPNIAALAASMHEALEDEDIRSNVIWQCAWTRSSSRPVDMVFSIMGLLGVILDTKQFGKNDRIKATIALCREILNRPGGRANWLGIAYLLPPCSRLSTFPVFPRTSVEGKAILPAGSKSYEMENMMVNLYPNFLGMKIATTMPDGKMDEHGYLVISRHALPLVRTGKSPGLPSDDPENTIFVAVDGTAWKMPKNPGEGNPDQPTIRTFAVLLGPFQEYVPGASRRDGRTIMALLVEEHEPEKYHVATFLLLDIKLQTWVEAMWKERTFSIGGPDREEEEWQQDLEGWAPSRTTKKELDGKATFAQTQGYWEDVYIKD